MTERQGLLRCQAFGRADKDADRQNKMLRYRSADKVVPFGPVLQELEDDEETDVTVGAGVAAGAAAEKIPRSRAFDWVCTRIYRRPGDIAGVSVGDSFRSLASCRSRILWLRSCQKANCSARDFPANC